MIARRPRRPLPRRPPPNMFPAYRIFRADLEAANDAVGSLDIAQALARETLAATPHPERLISTIFPALVTQRYRTTGERLRANLPQVGNALATMAVPHAFIAYERYTKEVLLQLR